MKDHHKTKASSGESKWKLPFGLGLAALLVVAAGVLIPTLASAEAGAAGPEAAARQMSTQHPDQVLDWNQIFFDTLIATNTPNSSSQRLGRSFTLPSSMPTTGSSGAMHRFSLTMRPPPARRVERRSSRRRTRRWWRCFPPGSQTERQLCGIAGGAERRWRGRRPIARARHRVGRAGCAGRPRLACERRLRRQLSPFIGGTAVGQWRPTPPLFGPMSAQGLAFTSMFVLDSNTQFRPAPPRPLTSSTYTDDFNAVKALGRRDGSTRTAEQTALARFWEFNASVHWNQAANQSARANHLSISDSNRLLATLNIAMADTAITTWSAKRHYGAIPTQATWRPSRRSPWPIRTATRTRPPIRTGCR